MFTSLASQHYKHPTMRVGLAQSRHHHNLFDMQLVSAMIQLNIEKFRINAFTRSMHSLTNYEVEFFNKEDTFT